jgi:exopolyphosphatase/guanosine-5'-triphosphate,3'-diphosphate pyrophosphatase
MNIASIDIGSNTVLLLIVNIEDGKINTIVNQYRIPRISEGLLPGQPINNDKIIFLLSILREYKKEIEKYYCSKVFITGTNALRIASNSGDIVKRIKKELNLTVKIIDGTEEARLSFLGASLTIPQLQEKVVIDIGGGSTEVIYGNNNNVKFRYSFQTGVVSLTEKYLSNIPYTQNNFKEISQFLSITFDKLLKQNISPKQPTIAVAGTPTTLSAINQALKEYDENKIEGSILKLNEIKVILNKMKKLTSKEIIKEFGNVVSGREDIILAGTLILVHLMEALSLDIIYVSEKGLRYGIIKDYLL